MRLELVCEDRVGISREILDCFLARDINLSAIEIQQPDRIFIKSPNLEFSDLQALMTNLRRISGVCDVKTVSYLPSELEHQEIQTLMTNLPDIVFSVDVKGLVSLVNTPALTALGLSESQVKDHCISNFVKGFSIAKWLESEEVCAQTQKLTLLDEDFLGDILPLSISSDINQVALSKAAASVKPDELVGAVIILKSVDRIGKQFNFLRTFQFAAFDEIHAKSDKMHKLINTAKKLAMLDAPLMILGETGAGKELIAKACHQASGRSQQQFLALNCAAVPDSVAESELFGVVTDDGETKRGIFELANEGSVLLDEIGDMSPYLQTKFLRLLETGCFRRVGDEKEVRVDVRIFCTTQNDLPQLISDGKFRQDLYYRLNVLSMTVPALRERKEDIIPLCHSFCSVFSHELQRTKPQLSRNVLDLLQSYPWPGNVRELRNVLYHALTLLEGDVLNPCNLNLPTAKNEKFDEALFDGSLDEACKRFEKLLLQRLYPSYPSTRQLAKRLGVSHTAIANKLRDYQITKK
ncbi:MAG: transcriptional regulator of aroF, aroG, tyrA and aromatic amino acid transport [Moritella dasanensis]|jgi:transcriptional regulator of aroF, aroG, tyrA and aromatic amino acid transport